MLVSKQWMLPGAVLLGAMTVWYLLNRPISVTPEGVVVTGLGFFLLIPILVWWHVNGPLVTKRRRAKGR